MVYDGNNYTVPQISTGTVNFIKQSGSWTYVKPLPVIAYTNLASYGDFSGWSAADLQSAMILVLTTDFTTPQTNTNYDVTYMNLESGINNNLINIQTRQTLILQLPAFYRHFQRGL